MVLCDSNECQPVACSNPIFTEKDCCPYCANKDANNINENKSKKYWSCFDSNDEIRLHGSVWKENDCLNCLCNNGERKCYDIQKYCTKLDCLNTIMKKGQCCPLCLDSIHSPYILSLLNNLTILKTVNQNHKTHSAISSYILYFLVLIVIVLVSIVIILLLKVLGTNDENLKSNKNNNITKLNQHFEYNSKKIKKSKSKINNFSLGNVIIPLSETENSLVTNRELSPLLLNCGDNNNANNTNNSNSSNASQSENLDTNNSTELLSELFNTDENSKSTLISNKTDETVLRSSINPSQNRIICYL